METAALVRRRPAARWTARLSLAAGTAAAAVLLLFAGLTSVVMAGVGLAGLVIAAAGAWWLLSRTGPARALAAVPAFGAPVAVVVLYAVAGLLWVAFVSLALWALAVLSGRAALAADRGAAVVREHTVASPRRPFVIMNPRSGGGKVGTFHLEEKARELGARVVVQWGMTEIGAGTYTRPGDPPEATDTLGRPASGAEVRVVDQDGRPAAQGRTGELQFRSPHMFTGYFRSPELMGSAFTEDGWLRCGDLAALNPDGSVSYRGRADELID